MDEIPAAPCFNPTAFLERLAVLLPRPRVNLLLLPYGVLAPRSAWRAEVVPAGAAAESGEASGKSDARVAARPPGGAGPT